jgi:predicted nucleotide-binding protein
VWKDCPVNEFARREHVMSLLMTQSESSLEALFFSLGLATAFRGPAAGWGRQKRIVSALMAAEERGDLSSILDLVEHRFAITSRVPSQPMPGLNANRETTAIPPVPERRPSADPERTGSPTIDDSVTSVFIVHGHDLALREQVARLVERVGAGRLEPVILGEQVDQGQTIIEKFERYASVAGYAIVLLTPDDLGGIASSVDRNPRGRQNVVLELGYFVGVLGRDRIAVLQQGDIEVPSDIAGVIYIRVDGAGAWKHKLCREMSAARLPIDFARIV